MILFDQFAQYSPDWWAVRRGVPTASNFGRIITAAKGELAAGHKSYIAELIGDELDPAYGAKDDRATSAMRRGTEMEPEARETYVVWTGDEVRQVGFCTTDCGRFGSSPDALVGEDGVCEYKCPTAATFAAWLMDGVLPAEHRAQVHGHLIVTGRAWCDFFAYLPKNPPFIIRVTPDDFTEKLAKCLAKFDAAYTEARERFGLPVSASPLMLGQLAEAV